MDERQKRSYEEYAERSEKFDAAVWFWAYIGLAVLAGMSIMELVYGPFPPT